MHGCLAGLPAILSHFLLAVKMVKGSGGTRTTCGLEKVKEEAMWCILAFLPHA